MSAGPGEAVVTPPPAGRLAGRPAGGKGLFPLPLTPFEAFLFLDSRPGYPMTFDVEVSFDGALDRRVVGPALAAALDRHPLLAAAVSRGPAGPVWVPSEDDAGFAWVGEGDDPGPRADPIDLRRTGGLRARFEVRGGRSAARFTAHHACCDGQGMRRFLIDFLTAYDSMTERDRGGPRRPEPAWSRLEPERLRDRGTVVPGREAAPVGRRPAGAWHRFRDAAEFVVRSPVPVAALRRSRDREGDGRPSDLLTAVFGRDETAGLRQEAGRSGVTLNDTAVAAFLVTLAEWNRRYGAASARPLRLLIPTDLRTAGDRFLPAANRTGFAFLTRRPDRCGDFRTLLADVREEMLFIKRARPGATFLRDLAVLHRLPGVLPALLRSRRPMATAILTNLGDVDRGVGGVFRRDEEGFAVGALRVTGIAAIPPVRPGTGVGIALCVYDGRLTLGLRFDPSRFDAAAADELLRAYAAALRGAAGAIRSPGPDR